MPGNPLTDPNWASDVADLVETKVHSFREKTTDRIVVLTRAVVFGLLASILGLALFVVFMIALTRGVQALLGLGVSDGRAVYLSYFVIGALFCLIGVVLMKKRHSPDL